MDLTEMAQTERLKRREKSPVEDASIDSTEFTEPQVGESGGEQALQSHDPGGIDSADREEILRAYKNAVLIAQQKSQEAERYRSLLEHANQEGNVLSQQADDDAFIQEMRSAYQSDPVRATALMIRRAQEESLRSIDEMIDEALQEERNFGKLLEEFLSRPSNSGLKPYADELEFLIRDKGLHANEAAELLRKVEEKNDLVLKRRSAAAQDIRNRSAVESDGETNESRDEEKDFERTMKKAKNLDEMFAGLRKRKI
ncbi:hypothetical protein [Desulfomonile tiedjei]|uniref:Uncharacterized protein n=1 Tax=Desulfomonile tiedjei (strain ATCC 49306 / DSM 6799 / DCB-1) TaxID=706587 RepID=I4C8U1_DESTA|nr:hypothetical protein [Desulfomonile tiedjei]AFM25982.1 hypothetical protein Desti_3324 [Desulfomonile tiedjei DSM 6799]